MLVRIFLSFNPAVIVDIAVPIFFCLLSYGTSKSVWTNLSTECLRYFTAIMCFFLKGVDQF